MKDTFFQKDDGVKIPSISYLKLKEFKEELESTYQLPPSALVEGPAYSLAMVVRFALGLSAEGGRICAIITDSYAGAVTLCCLRHLLNGGSNAVALILGKSDSDELTVVSSELRSCESFGLKTEFWHSQQQNDLVIDLIKECHNVLFGCTSLASSKNPSFEETTLLNEAVDILNELSTPVHCVISPSGIDLETGETNATRLYASSTLSIGAPLNALLAQPDLIGRHYLADLSFPREFYQRLTPECPPLFAEQPVVAVGISGVGQRNGG